MSDLVPEGAVLTHLGLTTTDDVALQIARDVEALLLRACNRTDRPWQAAQTARTEVHDGTGSVACYLDYPIGALTSVKLGYDAAAPDETLAINDKTVLIWAAGSPRLMRVDGGIFGQYTWPRYIQVVYDAAEDLPAEATRAVLQVTANLYNRRGSEDMTAERMGGYSGDLAPELQSDAWAAVVAAHRVPLV